LPENLLVYMTFLRVDADISDGIRAPEIFHVWDLDHLYIGK